MRTPNDRVRSKRDTIFTVEWLGGKLVGTRSGDLRTLADWRNFAFRLHQVVTDREVVICADLRDLQVLDDEVQGPLVEIVRRFNPNLLRSAILLPRTSALRSPVERTLLDARQPVRQLCSNPAEVKEWLYPCLDVRERQGLDEFLSETDEPGPLVA